MVDTRDSLAFAVIGIAAIARYLGISEAEVERLCRAEAFPRFRVGPEWAVTQTALDRYRRAAG